MPTARTKLLSLPAALCLLSLIAGTLFASVASAAAPGEAEVLAASPVPLTSVAVDTSTSLIYALEYEGQKAYRYDASTNAWTELPEAPINIGNNGGATYLNGKVYSSSTSNGSELEVYDIASGTWSTIANPLEEGTANITSVGGEIYMVNNRHTVKYNPATEVTTQLAEAPEFALGNCTGQGFRRWGGLQPYQGKIYGTQGDGCKGFAVYDIASNSWTELPETLEVEGAEGPVAGSALDPVSGTFFAYGGYGGTTLFEYNIAANSWATFTLPFEVDDGGIAYVATTGKRGIYAIQGQEGVEFVRYVTAEPTPVPAVSTPVPAPAPVVTPAAPAPVCKSARSETIHWLVGRHVHLKNVAITVNGKLYTKLAGRARSTKVSLVGAGEETVVVKITGRSKSGKALSDVRVYHPCQASRASKPMKSRYLKAHA